MKRESFLETLLITTKLFMPPSSNKIIRRHRLLDLLQQNIDSKLSLICGPAGFGKTTLAADWVYFNQSPSQDRQGASNKTIPFKTAWVSLDAGDNEIDIFWKYIMTALGRCHSGLTTSILEKWQRGLSDCPLQHLLNIIINKMLEYEDKFVLVLDDYHFITDQKIHDSLIYFIEYIPPQLHVILTSRAEPPLPLYLWRARGQVLEVDASLLRCTLEETGEFLFRLMNVKLSEQQLQKVFKRTEGWLVGLQLLVLTWRKQGSLTECLEELSGTQRYILDYLTREVLYQQSSEVQEFLLNTCFLPQFCASLCDTVLGRNDSEAILDYVEAANLFIVKLDGQRGWYRYHTLFSEALRHLISKLNPQSLQLLHEAASNWYAKQEKKRSITATSSYQAQEPINSIGGDSFEDVKNEEQFKVEIYQGITGLPHLDNLVLNIEVLSKRELEILALLSQGATNQDIAANLCVSLNTVKKHISNIYSKMSVPNRTQATFLARKLGLIAE
jgi:LuxR family maltose regulon positive regulatory protein